MTFLPPYREMKEEVAAEKERKRNITKERQQKQAEKLRLEEMAKRVSFYISKMALLS